MKGRKLKVEEIIKQNIGNIKQWAKDGATEKSIAKALGIGLTSFYNQKKTNTELIKALDTGRQVSVDKLENAIFESAIGGIKTLQKVMKVKEVQYIDGKRTEKETLQPYLEQVYIKPDVTAGIFLLKHWAKDRGYTNDPQSLDLKRKEIELKEKIAEENYWISIESEEK